MPGKGNGQQIGASEELILLAILKIGDTAYSVTICDLINKACDSDVSIGSYYTALDRLEVKGYVVSHWAPSYRRRGGRGKQCFAVTEAGLQALAESERRRSFLR